MPKNHGKTRDVLEMPGLFYPEKPVDLEFESRLHDLVKALQALILNRRKSHLQLEFLKRLRAARFIFQHRILLFYGNRYRGGKSGELLLALAEEGIRACKGSKRTPRKICRLLESYASEIRQIAKQKARAPRNSSAVRQI